MNLSGIALVASTLLLAVVAAGRAGLRLSVLSAFTAVWTFIIAGPAAIRYWGLESAVRERFWWSTVIVNLTLAAAVTLRWSPRGRRLEGTLRTSEPIAECVWSGWMWAALAVTIAVFAFHASRMPRIPLLELALDSGLTANQLTTMREAAGKLLGLPLPVQYVINWNVRVLVPVLLCALILTGRKWAMPAAVGLVTLTSLTLEKSLPAFAILATGLGVAVYRRRSVLSRPIVMACVAALLIVTALQTAVKLRDLQVRRPRVAGAEMLTSPPAGSALGSPPFEAASPGLEIVRYPFQFVYHRVLKIPSEVAYAWFDYFPDIYGGFLKGTSWWPSTRSRADFRHPANLVGQYYYHAHDPEHYLETIHAYAAFHADAWANFGYAGVIMASLAAAVLLLLVDIAIVSASTPATAGAAGAAFSILLTTLPAGGLQAALVAQGLLPALVVGLSPLWRRRRP